MKAFTDNLLAMLRPAVHTAVFLSLSITALPLALISDNSYAQANTQANVQTNSSNQSLDDRSATVRINMNNAEIRTVIQWIAEKTNKNFIIDPRVKGRISVLSNQPMTMAQAYQVFLTALDVYGFAAVESGNNVKIIPNAQARSAGLPIVETFNNPDADNSELVIHVIKVNNIAANEVVTILRPLVPQTGHLGAFPSSNSVVIADRANNINRLSQLINYIDSTGDLDIEVIPLLHATADDVVSVLQPLLKSVRIRFSQIF
ncbi:MAG: secretin N-terminal domain-containing protein, partial [Pseudomonadales bacterium]|nr:secretin N-terminal domain-containing protein [Pseudomonadales bacterium]